MKILNYLLLFILSILLSCDVLPFEHPYKKTYRGYIIKKGNKYASDRGLLGFDGHTLTFDFILFKDALYTPKDIAIHKIYGFSDFTQKNSMRIGWRARLDGSFDLFAYWHKDGKFGYKLLGNTLPDVENKASLKVRNDRFLFELNGATFEMKGSINGAKHRLFPYFEDGEEKGAPHDMTFYIYEY